MGSPVCGESRSVFLEHEDGRTHPKLFAGLKSRPWICHPTWSAPIVAPATGMSSGMRLQLPPIRLALFYAWNKAMGEQRSPIMVPLCWDASCGKPSRCGVRLPGPSDPEGSRDLICAPIRIYRRSLDRWLWARTDSLIWMSQLGPSISEWMDAVRTLVNKILTVDPLSCGRHFIPVRVG
jgi:hypothetical protein